MKIFLDSLTESIKIAPVWWYMAHQDVLSKYRRTLLGPWWITLGTGIGLFAMGLIWGRMFRMPLKELFPYLTTGFIFWNFIALNLTESTDVFVRAGYTLKTIKIPFLVFNFFAVLKNLYVLAHNFLIVVIVLLIFQVPLTWSMLLFIPGLVCLIITAFFVSLILSIIGARYRDLSHVIAATLTFVFLLTPIMWNVKILTGNAVYLAYLNPITHYLALVREPLLGRVPDRISYYIVGGIMAWLLFLSGHLYTKYKHSLIFWI